MRRAGLSEKKKMLQTRLKSTLSEKSLSEKKKKESHKNVQKMRSKENQN